jgi:hypothetical protein
LQFAAGNSQEHLPTSIAGVPSTALRTGSSTARINPSVCDRSAKRFAQDDDFVGELLYTQDNSSGLSSASSAVLSGLSLEIRVLAQTLKPHLCQALTARLKVGPDTKQERCGLEQASFPFIPPSTCHMHAGAGGMRKRRAAVHKKWLLNRGTLQILFGQLFIVFSTDGTTFVRLRTVFAKSDRFSGTKHH